MNYFLIGLYAVAGVLTLFIVVSVASTRRFSVSDALAALALILTLILAQPQLNPLMGVATWPPPSIAATAPPVAAIATSAPPAAQPAPSAARIAEAPTPRASPAAAPTRIATATAREPSPEPAGAAAPPVSAALPLSEVLRVGFVVGLDRGWRIAWPVCAAIFAVMTLFALRRPYRLGSFFLGLVVTCAGLLAAGTLLIALASMAITAFNSYR